MIWQNKATLFCQIYAKTIWFGRIRRHNSAKSVQKQQEGSPIF